VTHRLTIEVHEAEAISPTVKVLRLRAVKGPAPITWVAGQFVDLMVPTKRLAQKRSYSIASADVLEIAVTRVEGGQTSVALHEMALGSKMEMIGPRGSFTRASSREEPAVLIGTGTGVAPLRAMLQEELRRREGPEMVLLFGGRTEKDLLWGQELREMAAVHPRFRYEPTLSKGAAGWTGRRGWVQAHAVEVLRGVPGARVFLCGLRDMIDGVVGVLEHELPATAAGRIHIEEYD
jgi:NAD(P)H-flavin reductase